MRGALLRLWAMLAKEFVQMRRDRLTFAMMIGVPVMQLLLFGYAINVDPKSLPTALRLGETGPEIRSIIAALETSGYFHIIGETSSEAQADRLLALGQAQFVVSVPAGFTTALRRGERPQLLVAADATDPAATGNALAALERIARTALVHDLTGPLSDLAAAPAPFELVLHRRYNPEGITQYNIVPGLIGVILTMTMTLMTALAMTRERERGTLETLLALPVRPLEVMLGKVLPYVLVGGVQVAVVLVAAAWLFQVPMLGPLWVFYGGVLVLPSGSGHDAG